MQLDNKYSGIRKQSSHWETRIRYKDKLYSMGFYASVEAAALAWDITAASLRRCRKLNFPEVSFADLEQQLDALKCVIAQTPGNEQIAQMPAPNVPRVIGAADGLALEPPLAPPADGDDGPHEGGLMPAMPDVPADGEALPDTSMPAPAPLDSGVPAPAPPDSGVPAPGPESPGVEHGMDAVPAVPVVMPPAPPDADEADGENVASDEMAAAPEVPEPVAAEVAPAADADAPAVEPPAAEVAPVVAPPAAEEVAAVAPPAAEAVPAVTPPVAAEALTAGAEGGANVASA